METNFFGALWGTQAALPIMRDQGSGHIIQISSFGGIVAVPHFGLYIASKWALEGLSDVLAQEVAPFGIHVTLVESGGYATDWGGRSAAHTRPNPAYDDMRPQDWGSGGYDRGTRARPCWNWSTLRIRRCAWLSAPASSTPSGVCMPTASGKAEMGTRLRPGEREPAP